MSLSFETVECETQLPEITRHCDQEVIDRYAVASLDYHPIHINPEWKKRHPNLPGGKATIVHGQMTMGFMATVITDWSYASGGKIRKLQAKYFRAVKVNDTVTAGAKVKEKHFHGPGKDYLVLEIFARNQDGEAVAAGTAELLLP
ncbi:MaoC family dehydratase [Thalassovita sp.]|uniref:MaoC family dehydratase n=1 Tax=Thalassovita sp. TaxID=1979401 RepID=UPI0029DE87FD|nr:MaoC family dehydratase [Thalassovita sp.]